MAFIVSGLKLGRSAAAARPRRRSSITVLMLGGSAIAILMFFCLMMGSLFAEGATGVFIFLMWDAFVLAYLSSYILRTHLSPVAGEGSEGSVRMLATRRGIEATTFMVMPWPRSRSSLYPVVGRGSGGAVVDAYLVLEGGQARLLPYIGRFRTGESTGRMLEIVNARLDERCGARFVVRAEVGLAARSQGRHRRPRVRMPASTRCAQRSASARGTSASG